MTDAIREGTCFLPFHWGRRLGFYKSANNLTLSARDPLSHQPELKACAVGCGASPITPSQPGPTMPGARMNKIEALKAEKDGLDVTEDLVRFAREGWQTIADDDKERLKWVGRVPSPADARPLHDARPHAERHPHLAQARLLGEITKETGRNIADVTTRQQVQLRWVTIEGVPEVIARLEAAGLSSLQTGMDNIRGIVGCPATGLTPRELFDTAPIARDVPAALPRQQGVHQPAAQVQRDDHRLPRPLHAAARPRTSR